MKRQPADSNPSNSCHYYCVDSAGARRKGFGLLAALLMLAATVTLSSCASQGLAGSSANNAAAFSSAPNPFDTPGAAHDVSSTWSPSNSSAILGYNVYRRTGPGGPFTKLNSTTLPLTRFTDTSVQSGQTYYYVVTATNADDVESVYSNEISAAIP
jgi:hypothetical protein